ncbi:MAG: MBL fold metallo-hydrolase [Haliscomenobacteraceae bacterium CHB4]|nr:MBL fold metallo-hydrolase [Haliscomenobacteraceae bacterium CHB4]
MKLTSIHCGYFKLDGGAMFGIVPKRMWGKMNPPDENNLCTWALRALLVETGDRKILIDTGIGNKQDEKFRSHFEPREEGAMFASLATAGVSRDDITDVFLTHLHFDHCGGALWKNEAGEVELSFPNAVYWSNEPHFDWAMNPNAREKASFLKENFVPLFERNRLRFLEVKDNIEFVKNFHVRFFNGHTEALMAPLLRTPQGSVLYCADAMPSRWHIGMPYIMAYDIRPLVTLEEKARMLEEAVRGQYILFFEHDPGAACGTVREDETGRIVLDRTGALKELIGG